VSTSGSRAKSLNVEWCCREFLTKGFYTDPQLGGGGAMAIARRNPHATAGRVAQATQGSAFPAAYDQVADEAQAWMDAYGGASGVDSGGSGTTTLTLRKRYEFSRGEPGKREDSWTCIQRLATEVNWRAFMDKGTLYFISDDRLIAAKARYTLDEDTDGVQWIDFDIDQGKVDSEVRITCRTDVFAFRVGSVVAIRNMGLANGRWLVETVRTDLFGQDDTEVTLKAATPKLKEPDAETTEKTIDTQDGTDSAPGNLSSDTAVMRAYNFVNSVDAKNYAYAWGGGHGSFKGPYDCSGFVSAVLHAAGLLAQRPFATGDLINWGQLGEGKYMTVWVKENGNPHQSHTFMTFTLEGPNKGTQKFAEAGGAESNHTGWHKPRNKGGFVPRHWPST